jgi:hypothetical protein
VAYLSKKIEQAYILWFESSNQWVKFDDQQWFVFGLFKKNLRKDEAIKKFAKKFSLPKSIAVEIVDSLFNSIDFLLNPSFSLPNFTNTPSEAFTHILAKNKVRIYSYQNKSFSITYGSAYLEQYIHLPFANLEVNHSDTVKLFVDVFPFAKNYTLRIGGEGGKCLTAEEPGQIKRLLYIELANFFYSKSENDWLTFIHGSALSLGNRSLVISATGGSGKSTMAALLQLEGFNFVSDDFVPIGAKTKKLYPFPAAICLKNDSIPLLVSKGLEVNRNLGKSAFVKMQQNNVIPTKAKAFVFIEYRKNADFVFERMSILEAISEFLQETWVGNDLRRAKSFINWFAKQRFFKLIYSDSENAVKALRELMESP